MEKEQRLELIRRNAVEVVEDSELVELLKSKKNPSVYCGYETSGEVHLGHLVTITKLLDFQKAGCEVKVLFADWHTWLNQKGDWDFINRQVKLWEKAFKAAGLSDAKFIVGSSFQRSQEYIDDIFSMSLKTTIQRALRSMQDVARDIEHAKVSQVLYPFMQIEDIKALNVDITTAGLEQRKIHMLAREILPTMGRKAPICVHTPLIPSLKGPEGKMSSSDPSSLISVRDSPEDIKKKMNSAFCLAGVVKDNPALLMAKLLVFPRMDSFKIRRPEKFGGNLEFNSYVELEKSFEEKKVHPLDLKNSVSAALTDILEPIRKALIK